MWRTYVQVNYPVPDQQLMGMDKSIDDEIVNVAKTQGFDADGAGTGFGLRDLDFSRVGKRRASAIRVARNTYRILSERFPNDDDVMVSAYIHDDEETLTA